jgi:hypothetical protein
MLARHASGLSCAPRLRLSLCVFDPVQTLPHTVTDPTSYVTAPTTYGYRPFHIRSQPVRRTLGMLCMSRALHVQVPGNLISTAKYLDLLGNVTTANRHIDLRSCRIVRCLALYPADPLPALAFHAPVLPDYPVGCEVEEDATLGCHQACTMALCTG